MNEKTSRIENYSTRVLSESFIPENLKKVSFVKGVLMKTFLATSLFLASLSTFAASVKVTSFDYIRNQGDSVHPLAELCGKVEGGTTPSFVRVQVDPKANNPASYNTVAGADGKFCIAVITYRGSAELSLIGENASTMALIK